MVSGTTDAGSTPAERPLEISGDLRAIIGYEAKLC